MENINDKLQKFANSLGKSWQNQPSTDYDTMRKVYELQANEDVKRLQQSSKQDRIQAIHGRADLNPKWIFDNLVLDSDDVIDAVSIAKSFIAAHQDPSWRQSNAHMMIFHGDYGRGKSHIAGAIAHELINEYEISVLYRQLSTLLELRFFSYDYNSQDNIAEKFREMTQDLLDVDLLILDEVCVNETMLKKNAQSWLGNLLRQRMANKQNCILITNHDLPQLQQALGNYCYESIKEYDTYIVQFSGPSRRVPLIEEDSIEEPQYTTSGYVPNQVK